MNVLRPKNKYQNCFDKNVSEHRYIFKVGDNVYVKDSQISDKHNEQFYRLPDLSEIFKNSAILVNCSKPKLTLT